jgi:hypothetical protein
MITGAEILKFESDDCLIDFEKIFETIFENESSDPSLSNSIEIFFLIVNDIAGEETAEYYNNQIKALRTTNIRTMYIEGEHAKRAIVDLYYN